MRSAVRLYALPRACPAMQEGRGCEGVWEVLWAPCHSEGSAVLHFAAWLAGQSVQGVWRGWIGVRMWTFLRCHAPKASFCCALQIPCRQKEKPRPRLSFEHRAPPITHLVLHRRVRRIRLAAAAVDAPKPARHSPLLEQLQAGTVKCGQARSNAAKHGQKNAQTAVPRRRLVAKHCGRPGLKEERWEGQARGSEEGKGSVQGGELEGKRGGDGEGRGASKCCEKAPSPTGFCHTCYPHGLPTHVLFVRRPSTHGLPANRFAHTGCAQHCAPTQSVDAQDAHTQAAHTLVVPTSTHTCTYTFHKQAAHTKAAHSRAAHSRAVHTQAAHTEAAPTPQTGTMLRTRDFRAGAPACNAPTSGSHAQAEHGSGRRHASKATRRHSRLRPSPSFRPL
eukprot:362587-Chlamydomonas_euryale.AAC.4